jgi:disulfide bond formation protein DsbB
MEPMAHLDVMERPGRAAALAAGLVALVVIGTALVLEHGFGYAPCPLCLEQRWPYYLGVPVALVLALLRWPRQVLIGGLLGLAALFAYGLYLGIYQAGAEWRFWPGPSDCSAGNASSPVGPGGLLDAIANSTVVSCTDPSLRILGLSLAGWNAVVMAALIVVVLAGVWRERSTR